MSGPGRSGGAGDGAEESAPASAGLGATLSGSLPCVGCGYDLRGLSIRGSCPECGTAVRGTILHRIDPRAEEFEPLVTRRLTALSVLTLAAGAALATTLAWCVRAWEAAWSWGWALGPTPGWLELGVIGGAALSGVSLLGLVRLTRRTPVRSSLACVVALIAFGPMVWALAWVQELDAVWGSPYVQGLSAGGSVAEYAQTQRLLLRLLIGGCLIVALLGFRPNGRELVRRSLAMRTGRVDRQTILAMVAAVVVASFGDGVQLAAMHLHPSAAEVWAGVGMLVVAIGSLLFSLGVAGAVADAWRIRRSLVTPSPSLGDVLGAGGGDRSGRA